MEDTLIQGERDIVGEYVEIKKRMKADEETMRALETVILESDLLQADNRIRIQAGSKRFEITETGYETLEVVGIKTTITETRRKSYDEFDEETRNLLVKNPDNILVKTSKTSIRIR